MRHLILQIAVFLFDAHALTNEPLVTDPLDLNLQSSDVSLSCNYAVDIPHAQSCVTGCLNSCGIHPGASRAWSLPADVALCTNRLRVCAVPLGVHAHIQMTPQSPQTRFIDKLNYSPSGWILRDDPDEDAGTTRNYRTERVVAASRDDLVKLVDPMSLTYASLKRTSFALALSYKATVFVTVVRNVSANAHSTAWENDTGASMLLGSVRYRPSDKNATNRALGDLAKGAFANSPSIAALVQQWFLRYWNDGQTEMPTLALRSVANLAYTSQSDIEKLIWDYVKKDDTKYELDTFTTFNWRANVPPDCALRTDCASCNVHSLCAWCDMTTTNVPSFQMWAGWHATARTASLDGSACGIAPLVCAMMGGTPVSGLTCPREYDGSLW